MGLAGTGPGGSILTDPYACAINAQVRNYPIPVLRDDFSWVKGKHTFQMGGLFKFITTYDDTFLNYDEPTIGLGGNIGALDASLRPSVSGRQARLHPAPMTGVFPGTGPICIYHQYL